MLLWLGYMSNEMRDFGAVDQSAPSIFISERDQGRGSLHPYLDPFRSGPPLEIREISLIPSARQKVLVRRGGLVVDTHDLSDAADLLALAVIDFQTAD